MNAPAIIPLPRKNGTSCRHIHIDAGHAGLWGSGFARNRNIFDGAASPIHRFSTQNGAEIHFDTASKGSILLTTEGCRLRIRATKVTISRSRRGSVVIRAPTVGSILRRANAAPIAAAGDFRRPTGARCALADAVRANRRPAALQMARLHAGCQPPFLSKRKRKHVLDLMALHKLIPFTGICGRPRLADRNQEVSPPHGSRRLAAECRFRTRSEVQHGLRPGRTLRRFLHARPTFARSVDHAAGAAHHHRAGDRNAGSLERGAAGLSRIQLHRRAFTTDLNGGVFAGVYCAGKDETFEFLQNVLSEVFPLFPGKYVHIGGDEVPKENWKKCANARRL